MAFGVDAAVVVVESCWCSCGMSIWSADFSASVFFLFVWSVPSKLTTVARYGGGRRMESINVVGDL